MKKTASLRDTGQRRVVRVPVNQPPKNNNGTKSNSNPPASLIEAEDSMGVPAEAVKSGDASWHARYLRLAADVNNLRKRLENKYALEAELEKESLLRDLLVFVDNLERALEHAAPTDDLYRGVEITIRGLMSALQQHGVRRMNPIGQPFDPKRHEAVDTRYHPAVQAGTVVATEQSGFMIGERLLRPARVIVSR